MRESRSQISLDRLDAVHARHADVHKSQLIRALLGEGLLDLFDSLDARESVIYGVGRLQHGGRCRFAIHLPFVGFQVSILRILEEDQLEIAVDARVVINNQYASTGAVVRFGY